MRLDRFDAHRFALTPHGFSTSLGPIAKAVPGATWVKDGGRWRLVGYPDAISRVAAILEGRGVPVEGSGTLPVPDASPQKSPPFSTENLRPYQIEGVKFLLAKASEGCLLSDQLGLGKTIQAISAVRFLRRKAVIVCPSLVRDDRIWIREFEKWWPGSKTAMLEGVKASPIDSSLDAVVMIYDVAHAWVEAVKEWGVSTVVFDEAHALMTPTSRRSKACRAIAEVCAYRIGLTGTPLTNRIRDLWNVADTLSPGRFGNFFSFGIAFCAGYQKTIPTRPPRNVWDFDGKSNLEELARRNKYWILRRTRQDVGMQLPPRIREVVEVDIKHKYRSAGLRTADLWKSSKHVRRALDLAADGKLDAVTKLAIDHALQERRVLVFCHRQAFAESVAEGVANAGISVGVLHGGVAKKQRQERLKTARAAEGGHVLTVAIDLAVGVDLTFATVGIFGEITWEPHELVQAEGRPYRYGQKNDVLFQYVIGLGSVDEIMRQVVIDRLHLYEAAIGDTGDENMESGLEKKKTPDESLRELYDEIKKRAL